MKKVLVFLMFITSFNCLGQLPDVSSGTVQRFEKFPSMFIDARHVDVWLPDNYNADNKYAVVYPR